MEPRETYDAVCGAIEANPRARLVAHRIDEQHFGSFSVSFEDGYETRCVVNDRGFVFITEDRSGTGEAIMTFPSFRDEDLCLLLQALNL
jgi:hypothetical protein